VHGLHGHRLRARLVLETLRVVPCLELQPRRWCCLRARLVLESLRGVACLELAPARRPWRAAVAAALVGAGAWTTGPAVVAAGIAFLALAPAPAWHLILGVRSSAVSIFAIVMAAVVVAPPTVHLVTAVAISIAATAATPS
jgi:hypothetical protein